MSQMIIEHPSADYHCDLLAYLAGDVGRTLHDPESRSSIEQLVSGGVGLQVMAIYVHGHGDSLRWAAGQFSAFQRLTRASPGHLRRLSHPTGPKGSVQRDGSEPADGIRVLLAVENALGFCGPTEPVRDGIERLRRWSQEAGPLAYVSLTWALENRFGGGNTTEVGLKLDGERLLAALAELSIPIDLSHASDRLADDILDFHEVEGLDNAVVASHGNFRAVRPSARNLRDDVALEVAGRGGLIGLALVRSLVGDRIEALLDHVRHGLDLGLGSHLCLGTDFFCELDLPDPRNRRPVYFFPDYDTAASHRGLRALLAGLQVDCDTLRALVHDNLANTYARC